MPEPRTAAGRALGSFVHGLMPTKTLDNERAVELNRLITKTEAEAAELAGGLDAEDWAAIDGCLSACANDPREPQRYAEWYAEVLKKVRAYRQSVVIPAGQDETPRTGEASS